MVDFKELIKADPTIHFKSWDKMISIIEQEFPDYDN